MEKWWLAIKEERKYFGMVTIVFLTSAIAGYFNGDSLIEWLKQAGVFGEIEKVVQSINSDPSFFNAFTTIFFHNLLASVVIIFFGALFFGIYPFFTILVNGMMLGTALLMTAKLSGENPWVIFVHSILPHGIMELPAVVMAAGIGVHLGTALFRRLLSFFVPARLEASVAEWKAIRQHLGPNLVVIVILLFCAALIESALILYGVS
ncbi:stage II sporulation protein M [Thermoactinomyces mirandus]|uniref:Stage II sporulation protein M n=1 Tax=Thermoactinomyces mirandus TaxID=2756294 RepID=A0A7W2ARP5_9BACL|nr:stage II sporulation protein M [Thermoactinomyces mirandus]MBA4603214.1 stage II sporulation protein M [Thermoactinomyces mirandus]